MASIHIICKRTESDSKWRGRTGVYLIDREKHIYASGKWDIKIDDALKLVGGNLYLHETKQDKSAFGGEILEVREASLPHRAREQRVEFIFQATLEHKDQVWRGASHAMAWNSGILADD